MKNLIYILSFLTTMSAFSQEKGIVYYGSIESPGKGGPVGLDFNAYLLFDKVQSYYVTAKDSLDDESKIEIQKTKMFESGNRNIYVGKHTTEQGRQVYYDRLKDSIWWNRKYTNTIYGTEKATKIDWKFDKETKKMGKFTCKKAVGNFRGRTYTAWYTTEIPVPYGPWKIFGLPGLILEVYDINKEVFIYFKSIEYPIKNDIKITKLVRPKYDQNNPNMSTNDYKNFLVEKNELQKQRTIIINKENNLNVKVKDVKLSNVEIFE
jgi:GLPGLI family protein